MAYVYKHTRNDTGEIFYIGIGTSDRFTSKSKRNKYWFSIVNKCGYTATITHDNIVWEEACSIEKYLIAFYGRKNNKTGILANMTDGGEGVLGAVVSAETRLKFSVLKKGNKNFLGKKHTEQHKINASVGQLGSKNHRFGKKMTDEQRAKISATLMGHKHSEETKNKIGLSNSVAILGKNKSDSHKENIRKAKLK